MPLCNHHLRDSYKLHLNHQGSKANTLLLASNKYKIHESTDYRRNGPSETGNTITMRILKYKKKTALNCNSSHNLKWDSKTFSKKHSQ